MNVETPATRNDRVSTIHTAQDAPGRANDAKVDVGYGRETSIVTARQQPRHAAPAPTEGLPD